MRSAVAMCVLLAGADAAAQSMRVVVRRSPARPGFVDAVRIQLLGRAEVVDARRPDALQDPRDTCVVWVDEEDGQLVLSARQRDSDRVEVARVPAKDGFDADRALALKLGAYLDARVKRPPPGDDAFGFQGLLEAGAVGTVAAAPFTGGGAVTLGARLNLARWLLEAQATGRLLADQTVVRDEGTLGLTERELSFGARGLARGDLLALGGYLEVGVRFLRASGRSPEGLTGQADRTVPALGAGVDFRVQPFPQLALRVALGAQIALRDQRFALSGPPLLDAGGVRGMATVSVLATAP